MHTIFVNYRSCDEPFAALFLDKRLTERFDPGSVFRDSRTIRPGTAFPGEIWRALRECRAMVTVVGKRWLRYGAAGTRLIDDPDDYVRLEIAEALRRNILIVPVLVGDVAPLTAEVLPADIAKLADQQYLQLRVRSADHDAARLVDELVDMLGGAGLRPSRPAQPRRRRQAAAPATAGCPATVTNNEFQGPVDARYAIFGNVYSAR